VKHQLLEFYSSRKFFLDTIDSTLVDKSLVYDREYGFCDSPIMFIGEAPGDNEVKEGRPFCGAAGKNLHKLIEAAKLDRAKIVITNAFAFRTFDHSQKGVKNRTPNSAELLLGASMLLLEIKIIKPRVIVILGGSAEKAMLKLGDQTLREAFKNLSKHEIKEALHDGKTLHIAKTHHPSPLVFNRADKRAELYEFFGRLHEHK